MIGSHDSYTFHKATKSIYNKSLVRRTWKAQNMNIAEQYEHGVRMFDVRVCRDGNKWRVCHGAAEFDETFASIQCICDFFDRLYPDAIYRIWLEKGSKAVERRFIAESVNEHCHCSLCDFYPNLWRVGIKSYKEWTNGICNNNERLYNKGYLFAKDAPWSGNCHELHGTMSFKNYFKGSLESQAKKYNREIMNTVPTDQICGKEHLYLIDFVDQMLPLEITKSPMKMRV